MDPRALIVTFAVEFKQFNGQVWFLDPHVCGNEIQDKMLSKTTIGRGNAFPVTCISCLFL